MTFKRSIAVVLVLVVGVFGLAFTSGAQTQGCPGGYWQQLNEKQDQCVRDRPTAVPTATATPTVPGRFVETFDNNTGFDDFRSGVYHRDSTIVAQTSWPGDHDSDCGPPSTTRTIERSNPADSFYLCADHLMTSVGDTSGYSIAWFSPDVVFESVSRVCWDVNVTNLGSRQWWKVAVLSIDAPDIMSEVGSANLTDIIGPDRAVASYGGIGGWQGKLRIGKNRHWQSYWSADKATRYPFCFEDHGNGWLSFTVTAPRDGGQVQTATHWVEGAFPAGRLKVVFQDHNYTPNKSDNGVGGIPAGYTWHFDNIVIEGK